MKNMEANMLRYIGYLIFLAACEGGTAVVPDGQTQPDVGDADTDTDTDTDADADPLTITSVSAVQDVTNLDLTVTFTGDPEDGPATLQVLVDGGQITLTDVDIVGGSAAFPTPIPDPCTTIPYGFVDAAVSLDGTAWVDTIATLTGRVVLLDAQDVSTDLGVANGLVLACNPADADPLHYYDLTIDAPGPYALRAVGAVLGVEIEVEPFGFGNIIDSLGPAEGDLGETELDRGEVRLRVSPEPPGPYALAVWAGPLPEG